MGYSTNFMGELKFTTELTASQLAKVQSFMEEDCRDHPEWEGTHDLYGIDLALLNDFSGIKWSGMEKTYSMERLVNVVILNMRKTCPDFGLTGFLAAQGEDFHDRWELRIGEDGLAYKHERPIVGQKIVCPFCEGTFTLEEKENEQRIRQRAGAHQREPGRQ